MSMARTLLRVFTPPMRYTASSKSTEQCPSKYSGSFGPSFTDGGLNVMTSVVLVEDPTQPPVMMKNSKDKTKNAKLSLFGRTRSTKSKSNHHLFTMS